MNDFQLWFDYLKVRFASQEEGATTVEYGLLVALLGAAVATAVTAFGGRIQNWFSQIPLPMTGGN